MSIRLLTAEDAPAFKRLRLAALQESPTAFGSSHEEEQHRPLLQVEARIARSDESAFFGAFAHGELEGIVGVGRESGIKERHRAFVRSMYVSPGARNTGIASALMRAALDLAAEWIGVRQVTLVVTATNTAAISLYRRFGFEECGRAPQALLVDGIFYDEIQMVRLPL